MNLQRIPPIERPRERLLRYGASSLSVIELLAVLLGSGSSQKNVLEIATDLLSHFKSLEAIAEASHAELSALEGIGPTKALQLQAAFSLGKRLEKKEGEPLFFGDLKAVIAQIGRDFPDKQEAIMVLLCDVKRAVFHQEIIGLGTLTQVLLHPREVFYPAVRHKAHSLVLVHNHPSGDPAPSIADKEMTRAIAMAGQTLGISLLDHLIVGAGAYFSFREKGLL